MVPHVDDETIGLGGTIRAHVENNSSVHVVLVTDGSKSVSDLTARN
ncbi:PIG-L deacetylase family protein [Sinobaca sp. H24]|nr:PIG-L family deacetylase [Sinobaca sp. H24]